MRNILPWSVATIFYVPPLRRNRACSHPREAKLLLFSFPSPSKLSDILSESFGPFTKDSLVNPCARLDLCRAGRGQDRCATYCPREAKLLQSPDIHSPTCKHISAYTQGCLSFEELQLSSDHLRSPSRMPNLQLLLSENQT